MYLLAPIIIILISLTAIVVIVLRKFSYLKKLTVQGSVAAAAENNSSMVSFFSDLFPEIVSYFKKIDFALYKNFWFKEAEKFLRRLRLVSLKVDQFTNHLIAEIKSSNSKDNETANTTVEVKNTGPSVTKKESPLERYKKEEHLLIIEIAKNPKNPDLYKKLADVYIAAKNFSDAKESLETALELDPEDQKTKERLEAVKKVLPT